MATKKLNLKEMRCSVDSEFRGSCGEMARAISIFIIVLVLGFQFLQPLASGLCQGDFIRNIPMQYLQRMFPLLIGEWNCSFSLIYIVHYTIFKQARREWWLLISYQIFGSCITSLFIK